MVVQRTYQLTQTKTAMRFKAMDGVIRVVNDLGEKVSMSHKCGELDRHIPEVLGVSKAILESVIFCHQEESNWPLQEGAELKKRFDAIFESARYTKALEAIRKLRKARNTDTKDFKRDLDVLSAKMKVADAIRDKIDAAEAKLADVLSEMEQATDDVERADETLGELETLLKEIQTEELALERMEADIAQRDASVQRAYDNIDQMMSDADDELEALLTNYEAIIGEHQSAFDALKQQETALAQQKQASEAKHATLAEARGKLDARVEAKQATMAELLQLAGKFGAAYQFHSHPLAPERDAIQAFLAQFKRVVQDKQRAVKDVESVHERAEDALNTDVSDLKGKLHHVREALKTKQQELAAVQREKRAVASTLKQLSGDAMPNERDVAELARVIDATEAALQTYKTQHDPFAAKAEIQALNRSVNDATFAITELDQQLDVLRVHERDHIALDSKRDELRRKTDSLRAKVREKASECQSVLVDCATADDVDAIVDTVQHLETVVATRKHTCETAQRALTKAETALQANTLSVKHVESTLATLRSDKLTLEQRELATVKRVVTELLASDDLAQAETALGKLEKAYFDAKDKTLRCKNTITFLNIFKRKGESEGCCPLCLRGMSDAELTAFRDAINDKTDDKKVKDKIAKAEHNEQAAHERWKAMEKCIPSWRKWMRLETQVPDTSRELDDLFTAQRALTADVKDAKYQHEFAQRELEDVQRALREFTALADAQSELALTQRRLAADDERLQALSTELLGSEAAVSMTDVQTAKDAKQAELQELMRQLQQKQTDLQRHQEILQQKQSDLLKKREAMLAMEQKRNEYVAAQTEQSKLREREQALRDAEASLRESEPALDRDVRAKLDERETRRAANASERNKLRSELQQHVGDLRTFSDKVGHVDDSLAQNLERELQDLTATMAQLKRNQADAAQALESLAPRIATALRNLEQQESLRRQIRDNVEYRRLKRELEDARRDVDAVRVKIQTLPSADDVRRRVRAAQATASDARDSRATLKGRKQQLDDQIRDYKVQLRHSEYRDVENKYRTKLIEFETTTMAVADLDKYYRALDQSLIEYHSKKIEEINTIIRSLWQITYKGQDIDSIEIVSGPDAGSTSKAARSYDYRVVMKKAGARIDMRGRCSAGQKVLAALVIRLALAETFCLNCGILALDEPTTNLDTENKYGLAQAITEYVGVFVDCLVVRVAWMPWHRNDQQLTSSAYCVWNVRLQPADCAVVAAKLPARVHHARRRVCPDARTHTGDGQLESRVLLAHLTRRAVRHCFGLCLNVDVWSTHTDL